jgi:hypothetical protein
MLRILQINFITDVLAILFTSLHHMNLYSYYHLIILTYAPSVAFVSRI